MFPLNQRHLLKFKIALNDVKLKNTHYIKAFFHDGIILIKNYLFKVDFKNFIFIENYFYKMLSRFILERGLQFKLKVLTNSKISSMLNH